MPEESNSVISIRGVPKPTSKKVSEKMTGNLQVHGDEDSGGDLHEDPTPLVLACHPTGVILHNFPPASPTVLSLSLSRRSASQAVGFNPTHCKSPLLRIFGISTTYSMIIFPKWKQLFKFYLWSKLEFTIKKQFRISCKVQGWKSPFLPC